MPQPPTISVIMTTFQSERHLAQSIESILTQTFSDFELIVVDDKSTDNSINILRTYQDTRIRIIENITSIGVAGSLNIALGQSQGQFIAFQDDDGISHSERLQNEFDYLLQEPSCACVGSFVSIIDNQNKTLSVIERDYSPKELKQFQRGGDSMAQGSLLIRKSIFEESGIIDDAFIFAQDYDLVLRISEKADLGIIQKHLYSQRTSDKNDAQASSLELQHYIKLAQKKAKTRYVPYPHAEAIHQKSNTKPDFSVIMANYNNAEYIGEAIQSVIEQTSQNWELIICDDCSTDNSLNLIKPYLDDKRISLIKNSKNLGYIDTLNHLTSKCSGEIIGILDSDDYLFFDAIERMTKTHRDHPAAVFAYSQYLFCDKNLRAYSLGHCCKLGPNKNVIQHDCVGAFRTWKAWAGNKVGPFHNDVIYAEDKEFILMMDELGPLFFVDEVLYCARILDRSQSNGPNKLKSLASFQKAKLRAWRRRKNSSITNLSTPETVAIAAYGLGLAFRTRLHKHGLFFLRHLLYNPRPSLWAINSFISGLRGIIR